MLGKAFGSGVFSLIYVYSAELFPTGLRNVGLGSSSTVARIGGLLQPQMALTVMNLILEYNKSLFVNYHQLNV